MGIGMLLWMVIKRRVDIGYAVSSLSRFSASTRKGHESRMLRVFGYLKQKPNKRIIIDSINPIVDPMLDEYGLDICDNMKKVYPDAEKKLDPKLPRTLMKEL